jgi:hypothetical protein
LCRVSLSKGYRKPGIQTGRRICTYGSKLPFTSGENLNGQVAESGQIVLYDVRIIISVLPPDWEPNRGFGLVPVIFNNASIAVLELAAFKKPDEYTRNFSEDLE